MKHGATRAPATRARREISKSGRRDARKDEKERKERKCRALCEPPLLSREKQKFPFHGVSREPESTPINCQGFLSVLGGPDEGSSRADRPLIRNKEVLIQEFLMADPATLRRPILPREKAASINLATGTRFREKKFANRGGGKTMAEDLEKLQKGERSADKGRENAAEQRADNGPGKNTGRKKGGTPCPASNIFGQSARSLARKIGHLLPVRYFRKRKS